MCHGRHPLCIWSVSVLSHLLHLRGCIRDAGLRGWSTEHVVRCTCSRGSGIRCVGCLLLYCWWDQSHSSLPYPGQHSGHEIRNRYRVSVHRRNCEFAYGLFDWKLGADGSEESEAGDICTWWMKGQGGKWNCEQTTLSVWSLGREMKWWRCDLLTKCCETCLSFVTVYDTAE